jgi:hypothetical protein
MWLIGRNKGAVEGSKAASVGTRRARGRPRWSRRHWPGATNATAANEAADKAADKDGEGDDEDGEEGVESEEAMLAYSAAGGSARASSAEACGERGKKKTSDGESGVVGCGEGAKDKSMRASCCARLQSAASPGRAAASVARNGMAACVRTSRHLDDSAHAAAKAATSVAPAAAPLPMLHALLHALLLGAATGPWPNESARPRGHTLVMMSIERRLSAVAVTSSC